jgi:hypothetical protein
LAPEYDLNVQARIPVALCAIHNFTAKYDSNEASLPESTPSGCDDSQDHVESTGVEPERSSDTVVNRDHIAEMMWQGYQHTRAERGEVDFDPNYESFDDHDDN